MPPRRNKEKFQQLLQFERRRIIGLREGGFSYREIGARVQRNNSTGMRVRKQWTDEHRTILKTGSERPKVTSARDDRRLLRMVVNDCTASNRHLAARWSNCKICWRLLFSPTHANSSFACLFAGYVAY
ncbi:uncharacterized protein TNCV_439141 [Trichonephila clavipes]|nr:uncharacterized protein TNCV_439141 [Trichonephila clavipes]